jgi:outer membrane protein assembly factor BamB
VVYVGTRDGEVVALDANKNGRLSPVEQVLWRYSPPKDQRPGGVFGGIAVGRDYIYVGDKGDRDGENGKLYALRKDRESGSNLRLDLGEWARPVGGGIVGAPALAESEGLVFVGSDDGNLYAFKTTGDAIGATWKFKAGGQVWSTPAVGEGAVYFGSMDRYVYALSSRRGELLWRYKTGGAVVSTPLLLGDMVVVGSFDRTLYALDARSGKLRWSFQGDHWFWAGPIFDGEHILVSSMAGSIYALSRDGSPVWASPFKADSPIVSSPVVVEGAREERMLVVAADSGKLYLVGTRSGESPVVLMDLASRVKTPLSVDGAMLFVGAADGTVRGVNVARWGVETWRFSGKR